MEKQPITAFVAIEWLNQQHNKFKYPANVVKSIIQYLVYAKFTPDVLTNAVSLNTGNWNLRRVAITETEQRIIDRYFPIQDARLQNFALANVLFLTRCISYNVDINSTALSQDIESIILLTVASIMLSDDINKMYYLKYMNQYYKLYFSNSSKPIIRIGGTGNTGPTGCQVPITQFRSTGTGPYGFDLNSVPNAYLGMPKQVPSFTQN